MTLREFMEIERPRVEAALLEAAGRLAAPHGAAALYAVRAGGKRVRPLLAVACHRAVRGDSGAIYPVGAAVELVHTYSLLHDDLPCMDDDPLRRGLPTTHRVYGTAVATATGSALQQVAFATLARAARADPSLRGRLPAMVRRLARGAGGEGMVGGQWLDLEAEGREMDPAGLEAIHRGKTAALISAGCALGAIAADADPEDVDAMADYGTNLGLAFQVVDDLLDVVGDPDTTGKASGADAARSKATYPAVHGVEGAGEQAETAAEQARAALERLSGGDPEGLVVLHEFVDFVLDRLH